MTYGQLYVGMKRALLKKTTLPNLIQRIWIAADIAIRVSGENFQAEKIWLTADALRFSLCIRCFSFQELRKLNVPRPVSLFSTFFHGVSLRQKTRSGRPGLEKGVTRLDKTCFLAREETISGARRSSKSSRGSFFAEYRQTELILFVLLLSLMFDLPRALRSEFALPRLPPFAN